MEGRGQETENAGWHQTLVEWYRELVESLLEIFKLNGQEHATSSIFEVSSAISRSWPGLFPEVA